MVLIKDPATRMFCIRAIVSTLAVVCVMYLAKVWFIDGRSGGRAMQAAESAPADDGAVAVSIPWSEAAKHYGRTVAVEGIITATHNSGKACFLNFSKDRSRTLTVVIFASDAGRFPANPENYYFGRNVRVTGTVKEYRGKPEIIARDPSRITVIE